MTILQHHRSCDVNKRQAASWLSTVNCNSFLDHPSNQEVDPISQTALQNSATLYLATLHIQRQL